MSVEASPEKVAANLQAFKDHAPGIYAQLSAVIDLNSTVVMKDGVPSNINLEAAELYPADAKHWTEGQLKGFWHNPPRLVMENVTHCNPSDVSFDFHGKLSTLFQEKGWNDLPAAPVRESAFAFIFGIGLGYHLEELVSRLEVTNLFLIEPVVEFLHHSLLVVDWKFVFEEAERRGIHVYFIMDDDPKKMLRQIETEIVRLTEFFLDGSYFYYHNYSWALLELNKMLMQVMPHHIYSTGFYEDECIMMTQAIANIKTSDFRVAENRPVVEQHVPVFIAAAGPSLDNDIEVIKEWRSKVVLISCGTTLSILRRHGLRPDIHIEVENGPLTPVHIGRAVDAYGDLKDVILVSSITVHPDAVQYFGEAWFYYRAALSPTKVFKGPHTPLYGAEPTVSNGALAIALSGGFQEVYLFGVDCGSRIDSKEHHAKGSIYHTDQDFKIDDMDKTHDRIRPGNFGGMFRANYALDMTARGIFELKNHFRRVRLYNCSDGARIDGAQPFSSESIDLSDHKGDPKRALESLRSQWTLYRAGEGFQHCSRKALLESCDTYKTAFHGFLEEARSEVDFHALMRRYREVLADNLPFCAGVHSVVGPSAESIMRMTAFYWRRHEDEAIRSALLSSAIDILIPIFDRMVEGARAIFSEISEGNAVSGA